MQALIGRKLGMTQVFDEDGKQVPVTVIEAGPCVVLQRKTEGSDGYDAVQLGFGTQKEQRVRKPLRGQFKKAGVSACPRVLREVRLEQGDDPKAGETVSVSIFDGVSYVDVIGIGKGLGFQGVVRRHGMVGGNASHGSMMHRRGGAIGNRTWPGRIMKNKRMPGHMGNRRVTVQNLRVVKIRGEDNVILVEGAVPGPAGALLVVRKAIKKVGKS